MPLLVGLVQVARLLPRVVSRQSGAVKHLTLSLADAWFAIGPAAVLAFAGPGWPAAGALALALLAQLGGDALVAACRLRFGLAVNAWTERRVFAWMYLVDVLLAPIGLLAALAGRDHALAVALVMPLGGLLVIFARERRGRIENALELGRLAGEEQRAAAAHVCATRRTRSRSSGRTGSVQSVTGAADALLGADWEAEGPELLAAAHPPRRRRGRRARSSSAPRRPAGRSAARPSGGCAHADGSWRHVAGRRHQPARGPTPARASSLTLRDVHERRAFEEQLRHRAFHDELTGLANRALFYDRVEHALARRARGRQVAVAVRSTSTTSRSSTTALGHGGGDDVLIAVGQVACAAAVRQTDTAARLGGDEFGVPARGRRRTQRAGPGRRSASWPPAQPRSTLATAASPCRSASASAWAAATGSGAEELLRRADLAMYAAKHAGGGALELFDPRAGGGRHRRRPARSTVVARAAATSRPTRCGPCSRGPTASRSSSSRSWTCARARIVALRIALPLQPQPCSAPRRVVRAGASLRARLRARGEGGRRRPRGARRCRPAPT